MKARVRAVLRWLVLGLGSVFVLLLLSIPGLWWWAGQEGSLQWTLQRVARGQPLQSEGVRGSLRAGWKIDRIVWERDGLRLEARDITLDWEPLALLGRKLRLQRLHVGSARLVDTRAVNQEPLRPPASITLPWRVVVDQVLVDRFAYVGRTEVEASALAGSYEFDGTQHRWKLDSLQWAGGSYRGEGRLGAFAPLALDAQLSGSLPTRVPGSDATLPLQFRAALHGPLAQLDASAQLQVASAGTVTGDLPSATATARITPFEAMPVPRGAADFRRLDLAQLWPIAPRTLLSGHVDVVPTGTTTWALRADLRNELAGPWDAGRLPLTTAQGEGEWRGGTALVRQLQAQLAGGSVQGSGAWEGEGWRFAGAVRDVDPAGLHTSLAPVPLTGAIKLAGRGRAIDFDLALRAGQRVAAQARARQDDTVAATIGALELREAIAKGHWGGDALTLAPLRLRTADATLDGELELQPAAHAGRGKLQLQAPGLQVQANGDVAETRGNGKLTLAAADLAQAQRWLLRWPGASRLLRGVTLRGHADAQLAWQGGWRDPALQGRIKADGVEWAGSDPQAAPWTLRNAQLQLDGRLRDAALDLQLQAEHAQRKLQLAAAGRVSGTLGAAPSWRGQLARLGLQVQDPGLTPGPWQLQLQRATDWRFAAGEFELSAGAALLRAPAMRSGAAATDATLDWGPVRRQRGVLTTSGKLAGLPLSWIELVGGPQLAGSALAGDMVFDAQWNAQLGSAVRVDATLARVRGDVTVLAESADGAATRVAAGVRDARLTVSNQGEQLTLALLWDSERAGHAQGQIRTQLVRTADGGWSWPETAPLAGRIQAQLPRIGVWSLLAPPGWRLRGSLGADIAVAGTRSQPEFSGPLQADELALRSVVDGIELRNGHLRARLAGQKLVVSEFLLHGSEEGGVDGGTLAASGEGSWTPQGPQLQVNAQLARLRASIRSDRQLTVSGPVTARMDRQGTVVQGKLVIDRARIQLPDESAPRLGDDVLVRNAAGLASTGAERKLEPPAATEGNRPTTIAIDFDLGNDFRVSGRGLDTRLAGSVQVTGKGVGLPQMTGVIHAVGGTYEAYGQRMAIERGELRFIGAPDNPALDILAIRPNIDQRVGVQVTGRAQSPHVELYSEAGLSDAETLSWLVLGRASSGGGAETALLQRAAAALLTGRSGTGKGIAGRFGLDDVSVRPDSGSAIVRVGKRFADNFYAAYERSLAGATGTLYIFYDVSKRLTVRAEAGERTGLDLIFTFAFDGLGGRK